VRTRSRVTLVDVARAAGVSPTTASYVLNGRDDMRISEDAHRRVREAAASLGYRPNRNALSLRTATTKTVGMVCHVGSGGYATSQMLHGASRAARLAGHLLVVGETDGDREVAVRLVEEMVDRQVDGLLFATPVTAEVEVPPGLASYHAVLVNCVARDGGLPSVVPDEAAGGRALAEVLLEAGVAGGLFVVGGDPAAGPGPRRLTALAERLASSGVVVEGSLPCAPAPASAFAAVTRRLADGAVPRALVCLDDLRALGAYQALDRFGLRIPDDVSVVSLEGSDLAASLRPALTALVAPYLELGSRAVRLLMDSEAPSAGVSVPIPVQRGGSVRPLNGGGC
jgi:LacI family transcriptional regulator